MGKIRDRALPLADRQLSGALRRPHALARRVRDMVAHAKALPPFLPG
jgi:hypothetical protein